ncbi:hypothetical protein L9F63_022194, partial [Diploptera punctata]
MTVLYNTEQKAVQLVAILIYVKMSSRYEEKMELTLMSGNSSRSWMVFSIRPSIDALLHSSHFTNNYFYKLFHKYEKVGLFPLFEKERTLRITDKSDLDKKLIFRIYSVIQKYGYTTWVLQHLGFYTIQMMAAFSNFGFCSIL